MKYLKSNKNNAAVFNNPRSTKSKVIEGARASLGLNSLPKNKQKRKFIIGIINIAINIPYKKNLSNSLI